METKQKTYWVDIALLVLLILTIWTGLELHVAGHAGNPHYLWERWAVGHTFVSLTFLGLCIYHLKNHWAWYKNCFRQPKTWNVRRKQVVCLSLFFLLVSLTGILLLAIFGVNTHLGFLHYGLGLMLCPLCVLHIVQRRKFLQKIL